MKKLIFICFGFLASSCYAAVGGGTGGIAINFIENNSSTMTQRNILNLIGSEVSCVDNAGQIRTDCTFSGGGGGSSCETPGNSFCLYVSSGAYFTFDGTSLCLYVNSTQQQCWSQTAAPPSGHFLLETGAVLLLETGAKLELE